MPNLPNMILKIRIFQELTKSRTWTKFLRLPLSFPSRMKKQTVSGDVRISSIFAWQKIYYVSVTINFIRWLEVTFILLLEPLQQVPVACSLLLLFLAQPPSFRSIYTLYQWRANPTLTKAWGPVSFSGLSYVFFTEQVYFICFSNTYLNILLFTYRS